MKYIIFLACIFLTVTGFGHLKLSSGGDLNEDTIKIGLLLQDKNSDAAVRGAELAVRKANLQGGFDGKKFSLIVRSMEGPWGTGSKQAVNLIFEEKVWALTGCHDGRNAHLVEQAATKSIVPYISAWSSDPTLSQAFVPWFFNCVPTDRQQAVSIIKSIYDKHKFRQITVISGKDYDSNMASATFLKAVKAAGKPDPSLYYAGDSPKDAEILAGNITNSDSECLVLFCNPEISKVIVSRLNQKNPKIRVYSFLMAADENKLIPADLGVFDNTIRVATGEWSGKAYMEFRKDYLNVYNRLPGMMASYSYDATGLLIEAIRIAGKNDRELIQKTVQKITYEGVTGMISFDDKGNRKGNFPVMMLKEGVPFKPE